MTSTTAENGVVMTGQPGRAHPVGGASAPPVTLTMPMPPSINQAYKNVRGGGRAKTQVARDWEGHALWHVKAQRLPLVSGPVILVFAFERMSARADVSNRIKLAEDLLVKAGVIEDDRFVTGAAFSWVPAANGLCHVLVTPTRALTLQFTPSHDGACGGFFLSAPQPMEQ